MMRRKDAKTVRALAAVLAAAAILSALAGCGLFSKEGKDGKGKPAESAAPLVLTDFSGETDAMVVNDVEDLVFTVRGSQAGRQDISIVVNDSNLGPMRDDGVFPDEKATDGIYTASITISSDAYAETLKICAASGKYRSDPFLLNVYATPTGEELAGIAAMEEKLEKLEKDLDTGDGSVLPGFLPLLLQQAGEVAGKAVEDGLLKEYEITDDSVEMVFPCGGLYIFKPEVSCLLGMGDGGNVELLTLEPFPNALKKQGLAPHVDARAYDVDDAFPAYFFPNENNLDGEDVTLDALAKFTSRRLIIWEGHGGWSWRAHSYLLTRDTTGLLGVFSSMERFKSWIRKETVVCGGYVAFTARYVEKYLNDIDDTAVILISCRGGRDSLLADAFLERGAGAVVAFSEDLCMDYGVDFIDALIWRLTKVNPETGLYYTFGEAMEAAKKEAGADDGASKQKNNLGYMKSSEPLLFGGEEAEGLRLCDLAPETETGTKAPETESETKKPETESETRETEKPAADLKDGTYQFRIRKAALIPYDGGYRTTAEKIENVTIPSSRVKTLQKGDVLDVEGVGSFEVTEVTPTWIGLSEGNQLYPAEGGNEWILAWPSDAPYTASAGIVEIYIPPEARIENWLSPEQSGESGFRVEESIKSLFEDPSVPSEETFIVVVQGGKIVSVTLPFHP